MSETAFQRFPGLRVSEGCIAVPCGYCNAGPGQPCEAPFTRTRQPHSKRRRAAHLVAWWTDYGMTAAKGCDRDETVGEERA